MSDKERSSASDISEDSSSEEEIIKSPKSPKANLLPEMLQQDVQVPDDVWIKERKCLLMLLEARMLLRELVEYKVKVQRIASGNLTVAEIQHLLMVNNEDGEDSDFIADIQELKKQLVREVRRNRALEMDLSKLDKKIALLIGNRTSIQEIDRDLSKKKRTTSLQVDGKKEDFTADKRKMEHYSNLFYILQTEPKYLAKLVYLIPREKIENRGVEGSFLDALLLSLYGDAFSPREEFLMLQLFKNAIANEVRNIKTGPLDIIQAESVVPKMILSYNKRKQGVEYLKTTFGSLLKDVVTQDYVFEFNPARISQQLSMSADPSKKVEGAELDRKVKETVEKRTQQLISVCQQALERIVGSLTSLPYGLRLICKQLTQLCGEAFPRSPKEEIHKVIGYFVYYRFINLCITQPESFEIVTGDLTMNVRKNLISVAKVLQKLFDFSTFNQEDEKVANPWITANRAQVVEYFTDLTSISDAEDYLAVNKYMELTQKTKPLILISDHEIAETHELLVAYQAQVAPDTNDPLRVVLKDLGEAPKPASNESRDVQLTLENRFKDSIQEEMSADAHLYEETKELIIQIFKSIPIRASVPQTLMSILKEATKFAKDQNNKTLGKNITKVLKNMEKLEEKGKITKKDRYTSLLRDVALEVSNRASKREQQRKEIDRLQATLKNLKKHQDYMSNQINEFEKYLAGCRINAAKKAKEKRKKPIKFAFKELVKKEVVLESDVPESSQGKTKLYISMPEIGKFEIEAKIAGMSVTKMHLDLEDLLERKDNNIPSLDLDQVVLSVPNTILLFNKEFLS